MNNEYELHLCRNEKGRRNCANSPLAYNDQRLDAAAASTNVHAGDKRSISHKIVCGVTAAISQNHPLSVVFFVFTSLFFVSHQFSLYLFHLTLFYQRLVPQCGVLLP